MLHLTKTLRIMKKERMMCDDTSFDTGGHGFAGHYDPHQYGSVVPVLRASYFNRYGSSY